MEFLPLPTKSNTQAYGLYRQLTVALWLREFRYASPALLGQLIAIKGPFNGHLWHFLNGMKRRGLVQDFANEYTPRLGRLFMPGPETSAFLEAHGLECSGVLANPSKLRQSKNAMHDLNVQHVVLAIRSRAPERIVRVDCETQLQGADGELKPDALITSREQKRVAIEYEMTRHATKRVYHKFSHHLMAIQNGLYEGVKYIFPAAPLRDTYQALYAAPMWPNTARLASGYVTTTGQAFNPEVLLRHPQGRNHYVSFSVETYLTALNT